ncbi:MAG: omptin family outer membrane protease [Treponema sp.]|jgi:outer membrane protease|nr:omptin family outer membrane protease [Treponema sp.]
MKNITALAFLVIINCVYIFINPIFSQETGNNRYTFSVSPQAGLIYGQAFEYVYPNPIQRETKAELYSELKWDMKSVYYVGLQLDFKPADIMRGIDFFSSLSFKAGFPKDSGIMEDRDWMFQENSDLTRISRHINKTNSFFALDAAAGVSIPIKSIICVKSFLSGSWMHFSFTGRDGYYYYIDYNPPREGPLNGNVINYRQNWLLIAAGLEIETNVLYPFTVDLSFQISPFTYCNAMDEHILTKNINNDITSMGLFFEPKINIALNINRIAFSFDIAYRRIGKTRGKSYKKENKDYKVIDNEAGAGLSFLDTRFLVKINLF